MAEYSLTLRTEEDYRFIKKLLKAFDGASIRPVKQKSTSMDRSLDEAAAGKISAPFHSVEELMTDLLN